MKSDGSLVTEDNVAKGGDSRGVQEQSSRDVQQIISNCYAFATLKEEDSVVTWSDADEKNSS